MKNLLYALVALGILLLGFSLVFLLSPGGEVEMQSERAVATAPKTPKERALEPESEAARLLAPTDASTADPAPADLDSGVRPEDSTRAVVRAQEGARTLGTWTSSERTLVRGRVELPAGVPADETLRVVAMTRERDAEGVYGWFGTLSQINREALGIDADEENRRVREEERLARGEAEEAPGDEAEETGARLDDGSAAEESGEVVEGAAEGEGEGEVIVTRLGEITEVRTGHGAVAIAPVAADGTFEVPFPADAELGYLVIDGRYLYSETQVPVQLPAAEEVALTARVGGWLTGEVQVPADVQDAERVLHELRVTLEFDPQQFNFFGVDIDAAFDRLAVPDGNGRFEFRAVPSEPPYTVQASSDDLADASEDGIQLEEAGDRHIVLSMVHGARVAGRVLDSEGQPVAEARIRAGVGSVFGIATTGVGRLRSDEEGFFEFPHLPPGKVQLSGRKRGYLDSRFMNLELADRESREGVILQLEQGASVSGRVLLPSGAPAADVEVELSFDPEALVTMDALNAARGAEGEAVTDAEGRFEITGLGKGPFLISIVEEIGGLGHAARKAGIRPDTTDIELVLRPDPVLRGLVTLADGTPVPEFSIRGEVDSVPFFMGGDRVDESFEDTEGRFHLPGLREGLWQVRASAPGSAPSEWVTVNLPLAEGAPELTLVLMPESIAAGIVLDPDGNPVAGATVHQQMDMMTAIADASGLDETDSARTLEDGTFELGGLPSGTVSLVANHPDFVVSLEQAVELTGGVRTDGVQLQLRHGGTLTGEVFDAEGKPAGGVMVLLQDTRTFIPVTMRAGPDGTFRRERVKPGKLQITAMLGSMDEANLFGGNGNDPDFSTLISNIRTDAVEIVEGEEVHVVLGAPPADPVRLSGRVTHAGEVVPKAMVTLFPEDGDGIGSMKLTSTNSEGVYEFVLDGPGNYLMQVQIIGTSAMAQDSLEYQQVIPKTDEHVIDVELPAGRLSGQVFNFDGKPAARSRMTLTVDGGVGYGSFLGGRYVEQHTDDEGRFDVRYLPPGIYSVAAGGTVAGGAFGGAAEAGRMIVSGIRVDEGEHVAGVDFRLQRPGEINGQVVDTGGSPVTDASVFVRDEQGRVLERFSMISTDGAGRFRYTGVAPGNYTVSARTQDLASYESEAISVPEGGQGTARVQVEAGTLLKVSVVDKRGDLVKAKILVQDSDGRQVNGMISYQDIISSSTRLYSTDSQEVGPLAPGSYKVTAVADDGRSVTKPVTLSGQAERSLKIRLR